MPAPALERHLLTQLHVRLQEKFEESEGEPEVPPAETQRAPTFRTSTSTQRAATGDEELGQAEAKGGTPVRRDALFE